MTGRNQWVAVKFRDGDARSYTYKNEGDPVKVGDLVKVPDKSGHGWQRARVVDLPFDEPKFKCKAILGLLEAPADAAKPEPIAADDLFGSDWPK